MILGPKRVDGQASLRSQGEIYIQPEGDGNGYHKERDSDIL